MCRQIDAGKYSRCSEELLDAYDLAKAEDAANHADDRRDVLED